MKFKSWTGFALSASVLLLAQKGICEVRSPLQESVVSALEFMRGVYGSTYAPAPWKFEKFNWDLNREVDREIKAVTSAKDLNFDQARRILVDFIYSMKDYHVSISFQNTEIATLPFHVKSSGGKYFLAWIDRSKLPLSSFPFSVGDELMSFGGIPTAEAVAKVQAEIPGNILATDHSIAELNLTKRRASRGLLVPQGPLTLGLIARKGEAVQNIQVIWDYQPEEIKNNLGLIETAQDDLRSRLQNVAQRLSMDTQIFESPSSVGAQEMASPHLVGGRNSFTPKLGVVLWETPEANPFHAYLFKHTNGKIYGYVRIPSYVPEDADKAVAAFGEIITNFERTADALVIDQVNNPGGSVFYLYALASMLSPQPLQTPRHRMSITQADVMEALANLKALEKVTDDETARKIIGETLGGYPVSYEFAQFLKNYFRFLVAEWNAGRKFSTPYWIAGVDHINPNPAHFSKPILVLTNALDFSGGDFFPAILQDNQRATLFGARTAGAGGYVNSVSFPNILGIASFRVTQSLAYRIDGGKIENDGVVPEVEYLMSTKDVTQGYSDYAAAILKTMEAL